MDKSRKKSTVLCAGIFVFLGIWMVLTVPCRAAETNNDEKQSQIIRVGSVEDTFNYVDKKRCKTRIWIRTHAGFGRLYRMEI